MEKYILAAIIFAVSYYLVGIGWAILITAAALAAMSYWISHHMW